MLKLQIVLTGDIMRRLAAGFFWVGIMFTTGAQAAELPSCKEIIAQDISSGHEFLSTKVKLIDVIKLVDESSVLEVRCRGIGRFSIGGDMPLIIQGYRGIDGQIKVGHTVPRWFGICNMTGYWCYDTVR